MAKDGDRDSFMAAFGIYGAVGFQLAFAVVGGLYLGNLADKHFGTLPWLTLLGIILGSFGGFYNLIRIMDWNQRRKGRSKS
jgi:ATP synthase protein I